jgi:hypothetical protein
MFGSLPYSKTLTNKLYIFGWGGGCVRVYFCMSGCVSVLACVRLNNNTNMDKHEAML